ncbi:uncharacterized protein LOC127586235 [Pristis pectinata]|uniref:uncharacterized protein LOC127586235 n=1 Tax=Pristis pectinata TaxID=685728 RepID=UPI00223DF09A|nr:uncharacterized protein LOC127586235 [Pristis pectinata]
MYLSDTGTTLLLLLLSTLLIVWFFKSNQPQKVGLPPGPPALPIFGNLFQLDIRSPHKSLIKLSERYGPVFTFWFSSYPAVVVCGVEAVKEALIGHGHDFSGRYLFPFIKMFSDDYGIISSNGERWKKLRRFSLSTMRDFGMGKRSIEEKIQEEAQFLVTAIRNKKENPFHPDFLLRCATSNIICSIVFGERFEYGDKKFLMLMEVIAENAKILSSPFVQLYNNFPKIMDLLPGPHQKIHQNMATLKSFMGEAIQSHRESFQKDSPRDYIDSFLSKMEEEKHKPDSEFFLENLVMTSISLFLAGTETTSTTLRWALQFLTKYPEIQEKIHHEIDEVIGASRRPAIQDRARMPFTDAVIHEIQRNIDLVPMNLPHMAIENVKFRGYLIPKGTFVLPVLSSVLKDANHWETPELFNPNHFLDEKGCFKTNEGFMAFSAGKRICLGESLARMELFLFLTTLLQNFVLKPVIDRKDINTSPVRTGILAVPHVYEYCAVCQSEFCDPVTAFPAPSGICVPYFVTMSFSEPWTTLLVISLSILLLGRFLQNKLLQKGRLPPGPPALPIVGNLFQLDMKAAHKSLIKLSEQYGPVFTFWFSSYPAVVVCGGEAVKEALIGHGHDFSGRYLFPVIKKISNGYGVGFSSGERWKQLRRFTLSTLRNFGMGKRSIEERIQEEAQFLVTDFRNKKGDPFSPNFLLRCAASNIICSITFGQRFDYEDKNFLGLMEVIAGIVRSLSSPWVQLYNNFPSIMNFLPGPHQKLFQSVANVKTFLNKTIQGHKESLQKDFPRDYIDCFLMKMNEDKDKPDSEFIQENLLLSTLNLFMAGTETTSTTLHWTIQILAKYPEVQEKIHREIDEVIGSNRRPAIEDRAKMPYTDAVIHEVQRYIDIVPMNLPHMATRDVEFRGHLVPKGTFVIPVLSSVLKDSSHWETPESFNPNHFLDENGCFKRSENFLAFSAGKRMCLGESLARTELFLFLTTLLQNFVFKPVIDCKDIDISPVASGILVVPHVYEFCAVSR